MPSALGNIFHYKGGSEKSNGHFCIVIAKKNKRAIAVRITSKPRILPRTRNAVFELSLEDVLRIFPKSLYGKGQKNWHRPSKIFFADSIEVEISKLEFKKNKCPDDILQNIVRVVRESYPYVLRTDFMHYFL